MVSLCDVVEVEVEVEVEEEDEASRVRNTGRRGMGG